jgi:hypothetical protein
VLGSGVTVTASVLGAFALASGTGNSEVRTVRLVVEKPARGPSFFEGVS